MTHATRLALLITALFLVLVSALGASWGLTAWQISNLNHHWCATLTLLTKNQVPRPDDPAANPSREATYELYADFVQLRNQFGCTPS